MASKHQMTGMLGVYLTAAELTHRELIVSITSRNAKGADLLATDQSYRKTWSIQIKTNSKPANFWLLNKSYKEDTARSHIYIFVNLRGDKRPDYYIVPSRQVAKLGRTVKTKTTGTVMYLFPGRQNARSDRFDINKYHERWSVFRISPPSN